MGVLWSGRLRSGDLQHSTYLVKTFPSIFQTHFWIFSQKKIQTCPLSSVIRGKGWKRDEKGQKKIQFFFTARAVVRWIDRTTVRVAHRACPLPWFHLLHNTWTRNVIRFTPKRDSENIIDCKTRRVTWFLNDAWFHVIKSLLLTAKRDSIPLGEY